MVTIPDLCPIPINPIFIPKSIVQEDEPIVQDVIVNKLDNLVDETINMAMNKYCNGV